MGSLKRAATTAKRCPRAAAAMECFGAMPAMDPLSGAGARLVREGREEVTELLALGAQIAAVGLGGRHLERQALDHLEPVALDAHNLLRVVGEDLEVLHPEIDQDLGPDAVVPQVGAESEGVIGLDGVLARILKLVGLQLVEQADA